MTTSPTLTPSPPDPWAVPDAEHGPAGTDHSPPPVATSRRRRALPWLIAAGVVGAAALMLVGLQAAVHEIDTYKADLTTGSGDFPASTDADTARFYAADGYHLVARTAPGRVISGVEATGTHSALAVRLSVRAVTVPDGAAFGPALFDPDGAGYAIAVDNAGTVHVLQIRTNGDIEEVTSAPAPELAAGDRHELMVSAIISSESEGGTRIAGYVDGTLVVKAAPESPIGDAKYTGMVGYASTHAPAEWVVSSFARLGPDDMPTDTAAGPAASGSVRPGG